jgi:hypothetical protein
LTFAIHLPKPYHRNHTSTHRIQPFNRNRLPIGHPEVVDFGSGQGRSDVETAGVAALRRGFAGARTPAWAERRRFWMGTA